jgi:hypothetical protein
MHSVVGKVAFTAGATRGQSQGRSHAVELAPAGADIIAVDIAHDKKELGLGDALRAGVAELSRRNDETYRIVRPDLVENPGRADFEEASASLRDLPIAVAEPPDISKAVVFSASDDAVDHGRNAPDRARLLHK